MFWRARSALLCSRSKPLHAALTGWWSLYSADSRRDRSESRNPDGANRHRQRKRFCRFPRDRGGVGAGLFLATPHVTFSKREVPLAGRGVGTHTHTCLRSSDRCEEWRARDRRGLTFGRMPAALAGALSLVSCIVRLLTIVPC